MDCVDRIKGSGRPSLLADDDIAIILDLVRQNSSISLRKMAGEIKLKQNKDVCKRTIENYLFAENLKAYVAARTHLLKQEHKDKRKVASKNWLKWPLRKIKTLIFSDESRFDLYNGD
ncbi:hypothetical protein ENBRE01_2012 [Enteropsectra breve]|nr:hypothetical protein ENBRE01_2012 [Enteropsectra breve]